MSDYCKEFPETVIGSAPLSHSRMSQGIQVCRHFSMDQCLREVTTSAIGGAQSPCPFN
jgi:hypothetical protein